MQRREALAEGILACRTLTRRYLAGFNETNHVSQAPGAPNHVAWCLGHCALTMHRVAEKLDGRSIPPEDFIGVNKVEDTPRFGGKFDPESVAFGSSPIDDAMGYPMFSRCVDIYETACHRLAEAVRHCDEPRLDHKAKWGQSELHLWEMVLRMIFHNGHHTGQIADLRRALGMGSIFVETRQDVHTRVL